MIPELILKRIFYANSETFGALIDLEEARPFCFTMEPPYLEVAPQISCIPKGNFRCKRVKRPKTGETFQVLDVPGRENIFFGRGHTSADTSGDILIGQRFGPLGTQSAVLKSVFAFAAFMERMKGIQEFDLSITG